MTIRIQLYQRFGFAVARTLPNYYPDKSDAFVMQADLKNY